MKDFQRIYDEITRTVSSSVSYKKSSSSVVDKEFKRNLLQRKSVFWWTQRKRNRILRQKNCLLNPISDTDQREIADCKILKILVRCFFAHI